MKVIGIDPGITATGYCILFLPSIEHTDVQDGQVIDIGTIRPKKSETHTKISEICKDIKELIDKHEPDLAVLEKVFYKKNVQSLLRSSELRGAIILTVINNKIKILEYTPAQIKLTTTGNGRASKQQVRYFVERIILKTDKRLSNHAIDALAIAYTAVRKLQFQNRNLLKEN